MTITSMPKPTAAPYVYHVYANDTLVFSHPDRDTAQDRYEREKWNDKVNKVALTRLRPWETPPATRGDADQPAEGELEQADLEHEMEDAEDGLEPEQLADAAIGYYLQEFGGRRFPS